MIVLIFQTHVHYSLSLCRTHTHYLPGIPGNSFAYLDNPEGPDTARYNFDGFGVTWYTESRSRFDSSTKGPRPTLYRTTPIA